MYNQYNDDRVVKNYKIDIKPSYDSYMKVEAVLRYLKKKALPLQQYRITGHENHFLKCVDIKQRIGAQRFRSMECEVVTYLVEDLN